MHKLYWPIGVLLLVELVSCGWVVVLEMFVSLYAEGRHDANFLAAFSGWVMLTSAALATALAFRADRATLGGRLGSRAMFAVVGLTLALVPLPVFALVVRSAEPLEQQTVENLLIAGGLVGAVARFHKLGRSAKASQVTLVALGHHDAAATARLTRWGKETARKYRAG